MYGRLCACVGEHALADLLKSRLIQLLKEKEDKKMTATMATNWLTNEVAPLEAINKAGTFRSFS